MPRRRPHPHSKNPRRQAEESYLAGLWDYHRGTEKMLLSAVVVGGPLGRWPLERLTRRHFLDPWHGELFQALVMADVGGIPPADTPGLLRFLQDRLAPRTERLTGEPWLRRMVRLLDRPGLVKWLPRYVDNLLDLSARRQMHDAASNLLLSLRDPLVEVSTWHDQVQQIQQAMERIGAQAKPRGMR